LLLLILIACIHRWAPGRVPQHVVAMKNQADPMLGGSGGSAQPSHHCTDCICCILFAVAIAAWGVCFGYGQTNGNIAKMYHGINSTNGICGVSAGVEDKPLLYWCANLVAGVPTVTTDAATGVQTTVTSASYPSLTDASPPVCVAACPGDTTLTATIDAATLATIPVPECAVFGTGVTGYKTVNIFDRYCLPDVAQYPALADNLDSVSSGQMGSKASEAMTSMQSVGNAWVVLVVVFVAAVIMGYAYLVLLKCCAEPVLLVTIAISILGFAAMGAYLWLNAAQLRDTAVENAQMPDDVTNNIEQASKTMAICCWVVSATLLCLLVCFFSSINMAAKCVEAACHAVWDVHMLLLCPLLKALIKGIFFIVIIYGFLLVWTTADPVGGADGVSRDFVHNELELGIIALYTFCSLWVLCFLNALYEFIVAYMVADYYYSPIVDGWKHVECCFPMVEALHLGLFTHAGSLAFGSLLIAILQFIQKVVEYAEKKNREGLNNAVVSMVLAAVLCCVGCCKEIIEHINRNAYIDIAIQGTDFCTAAKNAIKMIIDQGGAMAILNGATWVFSIFGEVLITLCSGALAYVIVTHGSYADMTDSASSVPDPTAVTIVACLIGFVVALGFMNVFDMASDTMIYCVGYDRNSGKNYKSYAPYPLQDLLDDHRHLG